LRVHNTLTRKFEEIVSRQDNRLGMYVCGPTVYDYIHIGNARCFVIFDVVRRYLSYRGFEVIYVMNITDIEDKIIQRAAAEGEEPLELAERYTQAFLEDARALGLREPTHLPRATEHIGEIHELIHRLIARGYAYVSGGDVWFETARFAKYGKLSGQRLQDLVAGARVAPHETKRSPADFALWKAAKPGEPFWHSPWGPGRPGWHIECSAMAMKYLGETVDIHGGGADLIFPHHENEIAQSEAATDAEFVRYWMHNELLNLAGDKMSKSAGNVHVVRELLQRYSGEVIRLYLLSAHYRSPLSFVPEQLDAAEASLQRLYNAAFHLSHLWQHAPNEGSYPRLESIADGYRARFTEAMDDDFNTAEAVGLLFEMAREIHLNVGADVPRRTLEYVLDTFLGLNRLLGIVTRDVGLPSLSDEEWEMIRRREQARARRDWNTADRIREELARRGLILEDTPLGVRWRRKE